MLYIPDRPIQSDDDDCLNHALHADNLVEMLTDAMGSVQNEDTSQSQNGGDTDETAAAVSGDCVSVKSGLCNLLKARSQDVDENEGITVAVLGDWGSGKSGLCNLMKNRFTEEGFATHFFDAWKHEQADSIVLPLLQSLKDETECITRNWRIFLRVALTLALCGFCILLAPFELLYKLTIGIVSAPVWLFSIWVIPEWVRSFFDLDFCIKTIRNHLSKNLADARQVKKIRGQFSKAIGKIAKKRGGREKRFAVIFIDNLDRCNPDNAMRLLDSIKNFLNVSNCVFIFAVDPVSLSSFIKNKYVGAKFGTYTYLEKIFTFTYNIPTPGQEKLGDYFEKKIQKVMQKTIGETKKPHHISDDELEWMMNLLAGSRNLIVPRRMNSALMRFDILCNYAEKTGGTIGRKGTAIWICIYEGWPEIYLWARNNPGLFHSLLKAHFGEHLIRKLHSKIGSDLGGFQAWGDLQAHESFKTDENFRQFVIRLANIALEVQIKINNEHFNPREIELTRDFLKSPEDFLQEIPITGIP